MKAKTTPSKPVNAASSAAPDSCLYLVGTPIGNLEDITLRALRILKEVDQIACEDTRHTQKLLTHYDIHKPLVSYHEHNEVTRAPELGIAMEQDAKTALVSKPHEEARGGKLSELSASLEERPARGEITLLIGPEAPADARTHANSTQSLADRVEELIRQAKLDRKEALKLAAKERGLSRHDAYAQIVNAKAQQDET